jgi:hypothetical protein
MKQFNFSFTKTAKMLFLLVILLFIGESNFAQSYAIKSIGYWTRPIMSPQEAQSLAKYHILVVDLENKFNNYQVLKSLKKLNPKQKLLCYSNPMEIHLTKYSNRPWQNQIIDEITLNRPEWLLKTITPIGTQNASNWKRLKAKLLNQPNQKENYATFWKGMTMLNMSSACPIINGETYFDWMAKKLYQEILSDQIWDGYFLDNGTIKIAWTNPNIIDITGDSKTDRNEIVDHLWEEGMESYLSKIRSFKGNGFIIISNKGDLNLLTKTDGKFFENFPNRYLGDSWADGWRQCLQNAKKTGKYTVFQANRSNLTFVLASALLLDNVYVAVSQDDAGYFPELDTDLGQPLGPYENKNGIYYRKYQKAEIMVNPLKKIGKITAR